MGEKGETHVPYIADSAHGKANYNLKKRVWVSSAGVAAVIAGLAAISTKVGFLPVFLLYVLPYTATNFWLVLYTWLQHTDVDVPHFSGDEWDWVKGTFMTIDRPYGPVLDFLHHRIASATSSRTTMLKTPPTRLQRPSQTFTCTTTPPCMKPSGASRKTA